MPGDNKTRTRSAAVMRQRNAMHERPSDAYDERTLSQHHLIKQKHAERHEHAERPEHAGAIHRGRPRSTHSL